MTAWRRFVRTRTGPIGLALVLGIVFAALFAPVLDAHPPIGKNAKTGLTELGAPLPPSAEYPLGTDMLGRCNASRLLHGARISLQVGVLATLVALAVGMLVGLTAGYFGGLTDRLLMRLVDLVLAFPFLLLVIAVAALLRESGAGLGAVFLVLGIVGWTQVARIIRGKVLSLREMEFIHAARAAGASHVRILVRHLAPNVLGPALVAGSLSVAQFILAESTLSYLGLGAPPPIATWGRMLSEGQLFLRGAPWLVTAPGIAILVTVLGWTLLGEGLRDAFDPRERGRS